MPEIPVFNLNPDFFLGQQLHSKGTVVISVVGPGAVHKATPSLLASALTGPGGIPLEGINSLYRFENPVKWFFTLTQEMHDIFYENLHKTTISLPSLQLDLQLEHMDKEKDRLTIHWLPDVITQEGVRDLVKTMSGDENPIVYKIHNGGGKWGARCNPTKSIPHYAYITSSGVTKEHHRLLVTMPGRKTECLHCGHDTHWHNKCPSRRTARQMARQQEASLPLVTDKHNGQEATTGLKQDEETAAANKRGRDSADTSETSPEVSPRKPKQKLKAKGRRKGLPDMKVIEQKCQEEEKEMEKETSEEEVSGVDDQRRYQRPPMTDLQITSKETTRERRERPDFIKTPSANNRRTAAVDSDPTRLKMQENTSTITVEKTIQDWEGPATRCPTTYTNEEIARLFRDPRFQY